MRSSTNAKKVDEKIEWVKIEKKATYISSNEITIAFSKPNTAGNRVCTLKIGNDILDELGWKLGDTFEIFHSPTDDYLWKISKASEGFTLRAESRNVTAKILAFTWRKQGVNFTRSKSLKKFEIKKGSILLKVVMDDDLEENWKG